MARVSWVRGTAVPSNLVPRSKSDKLSPRLTSFIARQLKLHVNGAEQVACVLSNDWRLFWGVRQKHSHPNCTGTAIEVAAGIACTSGRHAFRAAAVYQPRGTHVFSGVELERLAEHFAVDRDMPLLRVNDEGVEQFLHSSRLPEPAGGRSDIRRDTRPLVAYEKYRITLTASQILQGKLPGDFVRHVDRRLREDFLTNSTADGVTKPCRKRHASCVFDALGNLFYGVNMRSDVEACDRCSEWNALGAAFVAGFDRQIVGAIVYSPDYKRGRVECCGKCRNALGGCINPKFGDMLIRYVEAGRRPRLWLYSEMPNVSYAEAEISRSRRKHS